MNYIIEKKSIEDISQDASSEKQGVMKKPRLPCRGCTRRCRNYDRCDGRPWRLIEHDV
jgi:hypothetical protein